MLILIKQACVSLYVSELGSAQQDLLMSTHLPFAKNYSQAFTVPLISNYNTCKHYKIHSWILLMSTTWCFDIHAAREQQASYVWNVPKHAGELMCFVNLAVSCIIVGNFNGEPSKSSLIKYFTD